MFIRVRCVPTDIRLDLLRIHRLTAFSVQSIPTEVY